MTLESSLYLGGGSLLEETAVAAAASMPSSVVMLNTSRALLWRSLLRLLAFRCLDAALMAD